MLQELLNRSAIAFFALFPVLNPPAMSPIFLVMTSTLSGKTATGWRG